MVSSANFVILNVNKDNIGEPLNDCCVIVISWYGFLSWCHQSALDKLPSEVGKLRQSYYLYKMLYLQPGALSGDLGAEHAHTDTHTHTYTRREIHLYKNVRAHVNGIIFNGFCGKLPNSALSLLSISSILLIFLSLFLTLLIISLYPLSSLSKSILYALKHPHPHPLKPFLPPTNLPSLKKMQTHTGKTRDVY